MAALNTRAWTQAYLIFHEERIFKNACAVHAKKVPYFKALSTLDFFGGKLIETMDTLPILSPVRISPEDFLSVTLPEPRGNIYRPTSSQEEFPRRFSRDGKSSVDSVSQ